MAATINDILSRGCLNFLRFRDPYTKNIDFVDSLSSSLSDETTSTFVRNLNSLRNSLTMELLSPASSSSARLGCIDQYIQYIFRLMDSLNSQSEVILDKRLVFEWRGSLTNVPKPSQYEEIIFDILMTLHTKAFLHYKLAMEVINTDINSINIAGQHLKTAAGIMDHIKLSLLPRWVSARGRINIPPECSEGVCDSFLHFFTATAQICAITKALQKEGGVPPVVITKLCIAVVDEVNYSLSAIIRNSGIFIERFEMLEGYKIHLCIMKEMHMALVYLYQAETLRASGDTGAAIACCNKALSRLIEQKSPFNPESVGLPKAKYIPERTLVGIEALRTNINNTRTSATKENDLIYHTRIPTYDCDLPQLPPGVMIMSPTVFVTPDTTPPIIFHYIPPPKTIKTSIFDFLQLTPSKGTSASNAPESVAMVTDSAIATATANGVTTSGQEKK